MEKYQTAMQEHRRWLHAHPETGFELANTHDYIVKYLESLGCFETETLARAGIKAVYRGGDGPAVAFRSDMDALSVAEQTGLPFASVHPGAMHACGHDGHMAILLGFAQWVADHQDSLTRDVVLLFEPAEETVGGALLMIEEGALRDPDVAAVFGLHLYPGLPVGKVGFCAGPMMAQTCEFDVEIQGKSAHGAMPHQGADAISAAAAVIGGLQQIVSRRVDPSQCAVITIGRMSAGEKRNILAERALLEGTLRTFDDALYQSIRQHIDSLLQGVGQSYGVAASFSELVVYPAVVNPPDLVESVSKLLGERYQQAAPIPIAEDFSWYQRHVPGLFMLLGSGPGREGQLYPLHSSRFDFDEAALTAGLMAYIDLIQNMDAVLAGTGQA
jgi:amidohydrolase